MCRLFKINQFIIIYFRYIFIYTKIKILYKSSDINLCDEKVLYDLLNK